MSETGAMTASANGLAPEWAAARKARRRRLAVIIAAFAAVLLAGTITAFEIGVRYAHAAPLANHGGQFGWAPPDNLTSKSVELGSYEGLVARWRPGHDQTFDVDIWNDASVTQTILGLADPGYPNTRLAVATGQGNLNDIDRHYQSTPVALAPHTIGALRITIKSPPCTAAVSMYWDHLGLRVRVGWFTRTETVTLSNTIYELKATDC